MTILKDQKEKIEALADELIERKAMPKKWNRETLIRVLTLLQKNKLPKDIDVELNLGKNSTNLFFSKGRSLIETGLGLKGTVIDRAAINFANRFK